MRKDNYNKREAAKEELLSAFGEIDSDILNEACSVDSKEKYASLAAEKSHRYKRYSAIAASLVLVALIGVFLPRIGELRAKDEAMHIPEMENGTYDENKNVSELFPNIEGRVDITSADMWNYYAARKAIYDATSPSLSKNKISLLYDREEEQNLPKESGFGVTEDGYTSSPRPDDSTVYYALDEFGELNITSVTYFQVEIKEKQGFLASKLGLGKAEIVITQIHDFDAMITFRNGDKYYSCLENGLNEFSTHKYIEGFFVVKNETPDTCSFTLGYDKKGNVTSLDCSIRNSQRFLPDEIEVIKGTTKTVDVNAGYSIKELEEFFNSKEA